MPRYRATIIIEFDAKRTDSGDTTNAIVGKAIEAFQKAAPYTTVTLKNDFCEEVTDE